MLMKLTQGQRFAIHNFQEEEKKATTSWFFSKSLLTLETCKTANNLWFNRKYWINFLYTFSTYKIIVVCVNHILCSKQIVKEQWICILKGEGKRSQEISVVVDSFVYDPHMMLNFLKGRRKQNCLFLGTALPLLKTFSTLPQQQQQQQQQQQE